MVVAVATTKYGTFFDVQDEASHLCWRDAVKLHGVVLLEHVCHQRYFARKGKLEVRGGGGGKGWGRRHGRERRGGRTDLHLSHRLKHQVRKSPML
jgi:hypothetical protein